MRAMEVVTSDRTPATRLMWILVTAFCLALFWVSLPITLALYDVSLPIAFPAVTVQCATVALALRFPRTATALHLVALVVVGVTSHGAGAEPWPLSVPGLLALGALLIVLGVRERWSVALAAWWLSILALVVVVVVAPGKLGDSEAWSLGMSLAFSYTILVLAAAVFFGQRRRIRADLVAARRDRELEQAQRRYVEERARLARDLHDVVTHSMSIVHMQAISAPYRIDGLDERATREFAEIARAARTALGEMRQLLGALRPDDTPAELAPQPQVADLRRLAELVEGAGTPVDLRVDDGVAASSAVAQLTMYRVVQEALSNVVRHAPGAAARVTLTSGSEQAVVVVENTAERLAGAPAKAPADAGGQGLRGMRERVELLGGSLTYGPTPAGGFTVEARIPVVADDGGGLAGTGARGHDAARDRAGTVPGDPGRDRDRDRDREVST